MRHALWQNHPFPKKATNLDILSQMRYSPAVKHTFLGLLWHFICTIAHEWSNFDTFRSLSLIVILPSLRGISLHKRLKLRLLLVASMYDIQFGFSDNRQSICQMYTLKFSSCSLDHKNILCRQNGLDPSGRLWWQWEP